MLDAGAATWGSRFSVRCLLVIPHRGSDRSVQAHITSGLAGSRTTGCVPRRGKPVITLPPGAIIVKAHGASSTGCLTSSTSPLTVTSPKLVLLLTAVAELPGVFLEAVLPADKSVPHDSRADVRGQNQLQNCSGAGSIHRLRR